MPKTFSDSIADVLPEDLRGMAVMFSDGSQRDALGDPLPAGTPLTVRVDFAVRRESDGSIVRAVVSGHVAYADLPGPVKTVVDAYIARGPAIAQNRLDVAARLETIS